jgi:hypothetical protein
VPDDPRGLTFSQQCDLKVPVKYPDKPTSIGNEALDRTGPDLRHPKRLNLRCLDIHSRYQFGVPLISIGQ